MTKTIARRFAYVTLATAAVGAGALLGTAATAPVVAEPVSATATAAAPSDGGGDEGIYGRSVTTEDAPRYSAPNRDTVDDDSAEATEEDTPEVTALSVPEQEDLPEVEVLDPAEQEDLPEVEVLEGDVMGEDYIPIEGDDPEAAPEDDFGPAPEDAMWSTDPDAVNVSITYGDAGEVVHVGLTDSEGNDVPTGSIAESWPDDNVDAED